MFRPVGRERQGLLSTSCTARSDLWRSREANSLYTLQFLSNIIAVNLWIAAVMQAYVLCARRPESQPPATALNIK
jgi:hypothetical protein